MAAAQALREPGAGDVCGTGRSLNNRGCLAVSWQRAGRCGGSRLCGRHGAVSTVIGKPRICAIVCC